MVIPELNITLCIANPEEQLFGHLTGFQICVEFELHYPLVTIGETLRESSSRPRRVDAVRCHDPQAAPSLPRVWSALVVSVICLSVWAGLRVGGLRVAQRCLIGRVQVLR